MSKESCQGKNAVDDKKNKVGQTLWDEAIRDCERELEPLERRVQGLKAAIVTYRNNRNIGAP